MPFRAFLPVLLCATALPSAACRPDDPEDSGDTADPDAACAAAYAEVSGAYEPLRDAAMTQGPPLVDLFLSGDIVSFYALFTPDLQSRIAQAEIQAAHDDITAAGAVGGVTDARVMGIGREMLYMATHAWEAGTELGLGVAVDGEGRVADLWMQAMAPELPEPHADHVSEVEFALPLADLSYVAWGGADELHNYHVIYPQAAWAYDFLEWRDGGSCALPCAAVEDYHIFGRPLLAPAPGVVVEAVDGLPDLPPGQMDPANATGNHVIYQVADGEYLMLAHMRSGSVAVEVGDEVERGQVLGEVGNSGNTSEPHLHVQLQARADYASLTKAMPLVFSGVCVDAVAADGAMPEGGVFVAPVSGSAAR